LRFFRLIGGQMLAPPEIECIGVDSPCYAGMGSDSDGGNAVQIVSPSYYTMGPVVESGTPYYIE